MWMLRATDDVLQGEGKASAICTDAHLISPHLLLVLLLRLLLIRVILLYLPVMTATGRSWW